MEGQDRLDRHPLATSSRAVASSVLLIPPVCLIVLPTFFLTERILKMDDGKF